MDQAPELARVASEPAEPMQGLRAVVALRHELDVLEARHVDAALQGGRSWSQIAAALGVSKQAAHKRHAQRSRSAGPPAAPAASRRRLLVTGQARRVVELARQEAHGLGHAELGPEHLLLGLISDDHGTARRALDGAGARLDPAREALAATSEPGPVQAAGRVRVSAEAREALEQSLREAVLLRDSHLGVEHLLLALLRDPDGPPGRLLAATGVEAGEVARRVHGLIGDDAG
jgi:transposase-like protein